VEATNICAKLNQVKGKKKIKRSDMIYIGIMIAGVALMLSCTNHQLKRIADTLDEIMIRYKEGGNNDTEN
jgi:hypothetical protein